ncbi:hypothetical protein BpHYR1_012752 [Brachionus plicatilis]|uniref:Uncharacterized protein n=1 Tax=Brachionus plicatilis TaxID=10195 RepID=A0A3M7STI4_BRAPC|nr:hypothetical protein BpHYR1_012752 [Brachionus plicatilis]
MEEYGSITIDNKNLLNDLLGLESNDNHELTLYQPNQPAYMSSNQNNQSNYIPGQGRKYFLESPTFSKKEDDIYRYVHSRISNVDTSLNAGPNFHDSLDKIGEDQPRNSFSYNNQQFNKFSTDASTRIGSNRLLSDLAVASISKQNAPSNRCSKLPVENKISTPNT